MDADFSPSPHTEAAALIAGKPAVAKRVFNQLLPELKARAFTVAGIESANGRQRIRDAVAAVPLGDQTWDQAKRQIVDELDPYLGDGADWRAELVLRVNGFQAFSSSIYNVAQADEDTTHLQYLHGECEVPTPSHLALNGVVLPKDDSFWDTHIGPWGHLGCVCYVRPMNPDLVDDERKKDEDKNPEDRNVIEGPALKQLRDGTLMRGGQGHDVSIDGPDNDGFKWHPDDFRIPLKDLQAKYDPEVWSQFQAFAQGVQLNEKQTLWDWLRGSAESPASRPAPAAALKSPAASQIPEGISELAKKFKALKFSPQMVEKVKALPPAVSPLLENLSVASSGRSGAHYSRSEKTIYLKKNIKDWSGQPDAMIHEIGHHLHYETGTITQLHTAPEFKIAATEDWKRFEQWAEKAIGEDWQDKLSGGIAGQVEALSSALGYKGEWETFAMADKKRISRFADTIMGLSGGRYGFGHPRNYMSFNGLKEAFTHAWAGLVDSDVEYGKLFSGVTAEVRRVLNL